MKTVQWDKRPCRLVDPIHSKYIDKENDIVQITITAKMTEEELFSKMSAISNIFEF